MIMYYWLVLDYNGWCVFRTENVNDIQWLPGDFPFVTTCHDVAERMRAILIRRRIDYVR